MAETKKRIIQYDEELTPALDDYLLLDSPTAGTRKILALNIGGGGGGGVDYSTTEQDTGLKWIDGKTIYQRTFLNMSNQQWVDISGLNIDGVINRFGAWQDNGNVWYGLDENSKGTSLTINPNTGHMIFDANVVIKNARITILYTKTTDTV